MANATLTTRRNVSGIRTILLNGVSVGEVWCRPGTRGFGLRLHGYYWSRGMPTRAGLSTTTTKRMREALDLAARTLRSA